MPTQPTTPDAGHKAHYADSRVRERCVSAARPRRRGGEVPPQVRAAFFAKGLPFVAGSSAPGGANFEPAYVRLRLLGVGLRTPYDAPGWDGCKWDPFGVTTLVDREKRVVVVVNAADIVEYMDAESCNASGMYVDEYMLNAGRCRSSAARGASGAGPSAGPGGGI
ncbi:hypothetical protein JL720_3950 [Aureococcus anophagefferens]|nr:hypothetical protein JL720_3950 [Aureococcus anophagefferens]